MKIAKIVISNSHLDYVARVIDSLDVENPPSSNEYGFAQFVSIKLENEEVIGVIHNSLLVNPEYASYGPRLSPKPDLVNFSPDYINEQGLLIGILLLGSINESGKTRQGIPRQVIPPGHDVYRIAADKITSFHLDESGSLQIHYYSQLIDHAEKFGIPLLEAIIEQLLVECVEEDRNRLVVLKQSLVWQRTIGVMRL